MFTEILVWALTFGLAFKHRIDGVLLIAVIVFGCIIYAYWYRLTNHI